MCDLTSGQRLPEFLHGLMRICTLRTNEVTPRTDQ
jgi:hypothetical protein